MKTQISNSKKELIKKAMIKRYEKTGSKFLEKLNDIQDSLNKKDVHKFRTTGRRFMALLELFRKVADPVEALNLRKNVKKSIKLLSGLRDLQVQKDRIKELSKDNKFLKDYYKFLNKEEKKTRKKYNQKVKKIKKSYYKQKTKEVEKSFLNYFELIDRPAGSIIDKEIEIYDDVMERLKQVNIENPETIHKLRVTFKKYRYMMEHLQNVHDIEDEMIDKLKDLQDLMGYIQDNEVLKSLTLEYINEENPEEGEELKSFLVEIDSKNDDLIEEFREKIEILRN